MAGTLKYAFRITHIDNIPHIIQYGLVRADSPNRNPDYVSIGDTQVIHLRGERTVKGYRLNDFVPFYLGPRSPMLYVIQHGYNGVKRVEPEKIVYCVVRLDKERDRLYLYRRSCPERTYLILSKRETASD